MPAAVLVLSAAAAAAPVRAATFVHPAGSYPADVQAVQAAVDGGGTVVLKAVNEAGEPTAFDFGPASFAGGTVFLNTDVKIVGETAGAVRTTIRGGNAPFTGRIPVRSTIRGIHFERPFIAAVYLRASTGADVADNMITGVVGGPWFPRGSRKGVGVWIVGQPGGGDGPVTGTITLARNRIADIDAHDGIGLALTAFEAQVTIVGNDVRGANFAGIVAFGHKGRVHVEGNVVAPGPERFPGFYSVGNGIQVGPFFSSDPFGPPEPAVVLNNSVDCANPNADGILLIGDELPLENSLVAGNRVTMHESQFGGISMVNGVSHTVVARNTVRGSGAFGLDLLTFGGGGLLNEGNLLAVNDVQPFEGSVADLFLAASSADTLVVGCHGAVVDEGSGTRTVGCGPPN